MPSGPDKTGWSRWRGGFWGNVQRRPLGTRGVASGVRNRLLLLTKVTPWLRSDPLMPSLPERGPLSVIFAFFLGLLLTAFIGVGVNTFHPSPATPLEEQMQALGRKERQIENGRPASALSTSEQAQMRGIRDSVEMLNQRAQQVREGWGRSTSLILIAFATLAMAIAVLRADQLSVLSNGLLLGGVFTMVYGVGLILATGTSMARFLAITLALVVTLGIGYLRFVRRRDGALRAEPAMATAPVADGVEARVQAIEAQLEGIRKALTARD